MPIGGVNVPVSASNNTVAKVPDNLHLGDSMQLALVNLGDGFYVFTGVLNLDGTPRNIKQLNGEVVPGVGMQVKIRDYVALINGIIVGNQSQGDIKPRQFDLLNLGNISGTKYITLRAKTIVRDDDQERPDHDRGIFELSDTAPAMDSGKILVAKLTIPVNTTQITVDMIDNTVKDYLHDMDELWKAIQDDIASESSSGGSGGGGGGGGNSGVVTDGLVLYMPFDGNNTDSSPSHVAWTPAGSPSYPVGANNLANCISFDGSSNISTSDTSWFPTTAFTLEFWLKRNQLSSSSRILSLTDIGTISIHFEEDITGTGPGPLGSSSIIVIRFYQQSGPNFGLNQVMYSPTDNTGSGGAGTLMGMAVFNGSWDTQGQGNLGMEDITKWNHYCLTFDSVTGNCKFYVNKVCRGSSTNGANYGALKLGSNPFSYIGAGENGALPATAQLDNLRVYNRVLSDNVPGIVYGQAAASSSEIATNYAADGGI